MTSVFGDFRGSLSAGLVRAGRLIGWGVFVLAVALAATVALAAAVAVALVLALAALLLGLGRGRRSRAVQDPMTLEARSTPDGWVIEPASSKR